MQNRLDVEMFNRGITKSREKAKTYILEGKVFVNNKCISKPGFKISETDVIEIKGDVLPFVSRGGLKLLKALETFGISVENKIAVDMGASTGGFTDCMLQHGAKKVYAVDVGTNQLDSSIKNDSRVINMENTNIRNMKREDIEEKIDFISIDTSFISLKHILPVAFSYVDSKGEIVALIKPQFEAGRENIGKNGIVKDRKIHKKIIKDISAFIISCGFIPVGITDSPVLGGDGNREFLLHIKKEGIPIDDETADNLFV